MRKVRAVFVARTKEFLRDRHALGWNLLFPFIIVVGFSFVFSGRSGTIYTVGLVGSRAQASAEVRGLLGARFVRFVTYDSLAEGLEKVAHHKIDLLVDVAENRYWVSASSPKGYVLERFLSGPPGSTVHREVVVGEEVRYVDWLLPGVLGMNIMFGCLFGVGYVIVRYRKNGVLKRFAATPLSPMEFLSAQVLSRFVTSLSATVVVYAGCKFSIGFRMAGSYLDLAVIACLGTLCLISLGVLVATRTASEEFAGGMLNLVTWPMMFLSGVWFSLEGSPPAVIALAQLLPLTHLIDGARAIMNEGKTLGELGYQTAMLAGMTILFLGAGSLWFRWSEE